MKTSYFTFLFAAVLFAGTSLSQNKSSLEFQKELNEHYADEEKSPLTKKDLKSFESLPFFEINDKFRVTASLKKIKNGKAFQMKTTTDRAPSYVVYAEAKFVIDGKEYKLNIYQSEIVSKNEYHDYLFLPFTDATNGNDTYGGGRFIDLKIPEGESIEIDFNKAYNPYCAYNHAYSCPIPPRENDLDARIEAGVKYVSK